MNNIIDIVVNIFDSAMLLVLWLCAVYFIKSIKSIKEELICFATKKDILDLKEDITIIYKTLEKTHDTVFCKDLRK